VATEEFRIISRDEAIRAGLKQYFTGRPCKRGHVLPRRVSNCSCAKCEYDRDVSARRAHPEKRRISSEKWRLKNLERYRAGRIAWNHANRDKTREALARYKAKKKSLLKPYLASPKPIVRTPEQKATAAYMRAWKAANRESVHARERNRRARKKGNGGEHCAEDILCIIKSQRSRCAYCKAKLDYGYHVDHIIPLIRGGSNARRNLQVLCAPCNLRKNRKDPIDYARSQGMLL